MGETARTSESAGRPLRRETLGLGILFGVIYFVQGVGDPNDGLVTQPILSLLKSWGQTDKQITAFSALLALPWSLKPLYGLLTDFVPLVGTRRRSYLLLCSSISILSLAVLCLFPISPGGSGRFLILLLLPTTGIAFADVVADALMIEKGQPRGITGPLQAVQWASLYAATILTGWLGGYLSEHQQQQRGFLLCAILTLATFTLTLFFVRERPGAVVRGNLKDAALALWKAARSPTVLGVGGFLFLWNFNPFSNTVLYLYQTKALHFSELFAGTTTTLFACGAVIACLSYGFYCRRVSMPILVKSSIVLGVLSTLAYWGLVDEKSAIGVSLLVGFIYMVATLIQLDLAARACPPEAAGTVFALLMALENLASSLGTWLGGIWYEWGEDRWGSQTSFNVLVAIGALFTAGSWLLWPLLRRNSAVARHGEEAVWSRKCSKNA